MRFTLLLFFIGFVPCNAFGYTAVSVDTVLMGVSFTFTAVHEQADSAMLAVDAGINEVVRIEKLISS